jgi:dihydropyrimidinase
VWQALARGIFDVVSSDHAPFNYDDPHGKRLGGREPAFPHIPNGIPGLETRLPILFSEGVQAGRIDIHRFVALTSTNAAKLYGLYPRKGTIAVGSDADLVIWDTEREVTIRNADLHHAVDYTPYEGVKVRGWPAVTLLRGEEVWAGGKFRGRPGNGQFMRCGRAWRAYGGVSPVLESTQGELA